MVTRARRAPLALASAAGCALAGCPADDDPGAPGDRVAPRLVAASPGHGAIGVYPAPLLGTTSPRVQVSLQFDEPMDPDTSAVALVAAGGAIEPGAPVWSADRTELILSYIGAPLAGRRPLADDTAYELALGALRDAAGNELEPDVLLEGGVLRFTTGAYDPLLNHACGHVLFGPHATAQAAPTRSPLAERTDVAHTHYTVRVPPAGDERAGYTRLRATSAATWHLFLEVDAPIAVESELGEPLPVSIARTPEACAGISHRATFELAELGQRFLRLGPQRAPEVRFIVELAPPTTPLGSNPP